MKIEKTKTIQHIKEYRHKLKQKMKNTSKKTGKTTLHESGPPHQVHWSRIIFEKLDTIVDPQAKRGPTLHLATI